MQRRVADLEAALAILSRKTDRTDLRRRVAVPPQICAGIFMLCVGMLLGGGAGLPATAQSGPSKVVAPFSVVDSAGHELFRVASASGTGVAFVYDNGGNAQVTLGSPGSGKPQIQILSPQGNVKVGIGSTGGGGSLHLYDKDGKEEVSLGSSGTGAPSIQVLSKDGNFSVGIGENAGRSGLIVLRGGNTKASLVMIGGLLEAHNASNKKVISLGVSGTGAGDFQLYNSSGTSVAGISAEQGPGVLQLRNAGGQERVSLGTATNGKGDVCASGSQGMICLSRLSPKY